ncbi:MAG: DUF4331 domain-containing protein [Gammaproteobacteria bacterium]|nr:DUF4331 domain-containing protein [Gammaproteobacteria bacterium]
MLKPLLRKTCLILSAGVLPLAISSVVDAANHREAPITALDPKADITDVYAFVSYDDPTKATLIMNVDPLLEPSNGPTYFPFDPEITYAIHVDNDHDAKADVTFRFRFRTEQRLPNVFTVFAGAGDGISAPESSPPPVAPGTVVVPPAITALDGPGSEGLGQRQRYSVEMIRHSRRYQRPRTLGDDLIAVPSNAGPRTMPDYDSLFEQGIYELDNDIRVFAGTVDDPFAIDLGAAFDTLNFRVGAAGSGVAAVLTDAQDASMERNFASDDVAGFNVNSIAIEVPVEWLTKHRNQPAADDPNATIGVWATTSRPRVKILSRNPAKPNWTSRSVVQIQRMANPLYNELVNGVGVKDEFSKSQPKDDAQFAHFALDPVIARILNAAVAAMLGDDVLPIPTPPRTDLLPLLQYLPPIAAPGTPAGPVADLLRLNTGVPPTPAEQRSRLGLLTLLDDDPSNDDPAGFPNGRRVSDDVVDTVARSAVGVLTGDPQFTGFPHNRLGDGVNVNDVPHLETFPYVAPAHSGRNSAHVDPGEPGCVDPIAFSDINCPLD